MDRNTHTNTMESVFSQKKFFVSSVCVGAFYSSAFGGTRPGGGMVDTEDLKSSSFGSTGSSPVLGTTIQ